MRLLAALTIITATAGAAWAQDAGLARTAGAYASVESDSANQCQRLCADDGLCMAWTFTTANTCQMTAIVPDPTPSPGAVSGLSARAPGYSLRPMIAQAAPAPQPDPEPIPGLRRLMVAESEPSLRVLDVESELLGGPEPEVRRSN